MTTPTDLQLSSYDYELPPELIAQAPAEPRDSSRLLVFRSGEITHHQFRELPQFLHPGDLLVLNNTRVIPARLRGQKIGKIPVPVEVLLLAEKTPRQWLGLVKPGRRIRPGHRLEFRDRTDQDKIYRAEILAYDPKTRGRLMEFDLPPGERLLDQLDNFGEMPLPPYIDRHPACPEQYQTVYGQIPGAVAAPTAGLHFTPGLLKTLQDGGINHCFVTLHVGLGTFRPLELEDVTQHQLHQEWIEVSPDTVAQIQKTQASGGRIIAVGTTVVRSLETAAQGGLLAPFCGESNLFIYPGYQWQVVEGLITNFHLPRSSLLLLVSALIGRQALLDLYHLAIQARYRFYSFGDAMLLLP
ncbi:tRNA preQ1(34) S-adenosylmethionine ribosyltransferase-isomerase QueA [Thermosynechococcaceae cyanobacterium BACA0444]|uniref:S-adenosylmethionine:tRNA ribosyltransferase-isomerase n=1 Tax=Pseudocalidococcus azoricus BACA0444 TaxID=2918990 RepID=A0AAE4FV90_9CYAN|nr:tRNA preQ1(34) S-adenosylmethionine ribosyltransferase-isomerase QueA [Pseudocalidococcus azoricus]MDS3861917.1 tRNA preQ1(34) S-adenosylmethionine ribosyltransferase-isomerase QueA [Pseudocalidococcus azoricus BACA0444]